MKAHYDILKRPVFTPKAKNGFKKKKEYTFVVEIHATKPQIKHAFQEAFAVKVEKVRTCIIHRSFKRSGKTTQKIPNFKKAMILLKEGYQLSIYDTAMQQTEGAK